MNEKMSNESYESNSSLDLFHEGQELAAGGDIEMARTKIEESIAIARNTDDEQWLEYLEATIAYLDGDLETLRSHIANVGKNDQVLLRLADGLEKRGTPDYKEDYSI